jgi:protein-S-isoprenylcysteine O-methyltransferase Ste14
LAPRTALPEDGKAERDRLVTLRYLVVAPARKSRSHEGRIDGRGEETPDRPPPTAISNKSRSDSGPDRARLLRRLTHSLPSPTERLFRICANLIGAASAAVFSYSFLHFYLQSHRLIGIVFFLQQTLVALAYLFRRPARLVSRRLDDWLLAFGGTFAGVLFRPEGAHPAWGVSTGLVMQLLGAAIAVASLLSLGRSFGFAAADRGVVIRGPYAVVRHPMYASYLLLQSGYFLQSLSARNAIVLLFGSLCNVGRALAEERLLANNHEYAVYRRRVRRRMIPGVW